MDEFIQQQLDGREPAVTEFLKKHPGHKRSLRPVLEGAELVYSEFQRFRRQYPGVDIKKLAPENY